MAAIRSWLSFVKSCVRKRLAPFIRGGPHCSCLHSQAILLLTPKPAYPPSIRQLRLSLLPGPYCFPQAVGVLFWCAEMSDHA